MPKHPVIIGAPRKETVRPMVDGLCDPKTAPILGRSRLELDDRLSKPGLRDPPRRGSPDAGERHQLIGVGYQKLCDAKGWLRRRGLEARRATARSKILSAPHTL
jgi:hypothetical protein